MADTQTATPVVDELYTLIDQDFREGLNFSHLKDADLVVEVVAIDDGLVFTRYANPNKPDPPPIDVDMFLRSYRPVTNAEREQVERANFST